MLCIVCGYVNHPSTFFFRYFLCVALAGRSVEQILLLPVLSQTVLNLLPPFYRSVKVSWFQLSRQVEHGIIFVEGSGSSSCPLSSTVRFVYWKLSWLNCTEHRCVARYCLWDFAVDWNTVWLNCQLWHFYPSCP